MNKSSLTKCPHMLHGGDYNPDQWQQMPGMLDEDMRLMRLAGCNAMSVGIFAWTALEPREGHYTFDWLDRVMDQLAAHEAYAVLATPSGARPAWLSHQYPEVLRVQANRVRNLHGGRHNHCYTSPVYREKVQQINSQLAERYQQHPALLLWHLSNEYGGACYCPLCEAAFRQWLRARYQDDLNALNQAWYTAFWSHTYTDWSQIEAPAPQGEGFNALHLDWRRFCTTQTVDFIKAELAPLRRFTPDIPATTNLMGTYDGLDYWKLAPVLDVISWDSYPLWHHGNDAELAAEIAFVHNLNRSLKGGKPFLLMESTPSVTNWQPYGKLKRPGMHILSSLQAIAHGSDSVQYFQWRKSRGSSEQLHGAVVDHVGHEHTRVFADVAELGQMLAGLDDVVGSSVPAEVALIFDWENRWALDDAAGPRNDGKKDYCGTCHQHSVPFWQLGIPYDVINMDGDFSRYKLIIAPMLYMLRPGVAERLTAFVRAGGVLVSTYLSGWVNESTLCFLGGFPGPLREVLGIWAEEIDALGPDDSNTMRFADENTLGLHGDYRLHTFCERIHAESARVLATYTSDFYAGEPALTVNTLEQGEAFYLAARSDAAFLSDFYRTLAARLRLRPALPTVLPTGVTAQRRSDGQSDFIFVMNFTSEEQAVDLGETCYTDQFSREAVSGVMTLPGYGVRVIVR